MAVATPPKTPGMTKKHFEQIASVFEKCFEESQYLMETELLDTVIDRLVPVFEHANENFDADKFRSAAGYKGEVY